MTYKNKQIEKVADSDEREQRRNIIIAEDEKYITKFTRYQQKYVENIQEGWTKAIPNPI